VSRSGLTRLLKTAVEMGFIIFLFYSNLLMGEFTRSNGAQGKGIVAALKNIVTAENFAIACASSLIGHIVFERLRKWLLDDG
jgi:hypothetical protein